MNNFERKPFALAPGGAENSQGVRRCDLSEAHFLERPERPTASRPVPGLGRMETLGDEIESRHS